MSGVVYIGHSGKEQHTQVGVGRVVTSESLGTVAQNSRDVSSSNCHSVWNISHFYHTDNKCMHVWMNLYMYRCICGCTMIAVKITIAVGTALNNQSSNQSIKQSLTYIGNIKESLFYLITPLDHITFHIIGYCTSNMWSFWHISLEETYCQHTGYSFR